MAVDASVLVSADAAQRVLRGGLRRLRRRVRVLLAIRLTTRGIALVAAAAAVVVLANKLYGVVYPAAVPALALAAVATLSLIAALVWPLSDQIIAMSADTRLRLWDRLATAIELSRSPRPSGMERAQVMDAVDCVGRLRPREAYPLRADRVTKAMLICLIALLAVQLLPIPALLLSQRERDEREGLRRVAQKLEPVAKKLEAEADRTDDEEARRVARTLKKLARDLRMGKLDKKQALLDLAEVEKQLKSLEKGIKPPSLKTAKRAAEQMSRQGRQGLAAKARELAKLAAKQGDRALKEKLEKLAKKAEAAKKSEELRKLARELEQSATKLGTELSPSALVDTLAAAIGNEDWEGALAELSALQIGLDGPGRELSEKEVRELAEQLRKLAEGLKDTDLKALAECLQQACQCLGEGDCTGAAACLGKAGAAAGRKGLRGVRLREATREAGECAGWCAGGLRGRCAGSGSGAGMGVGPDRGTRQGIPPGTPGASLYAPRRTDVETTPERVRSHVRPGGEMLTTPTTTRGAPSSATDSRVPYYEVIGDYSRAAEEALESEEVPPAYRPTVRQYFESLQSAEEP